MTASGDVPTHNCHDVPAYNHGDYHHVSDKDNSHVYHIHLSYDSNSNNCDDGDDHHSSTAEAKLSSAVGVPTQKHAVLPEVSSITTTSRTTVPGLEKQAFELRLINGLGWQHDFAALVLFSTSPAGMFDPDVME